MSTSWKSAPSWIIAAIVCTLSAFAGCYVGHQRQVEHAAFQDSALGEEHVVNFAPRDARQLTQAALRGDGLLFEVQPDGAIITFWRNADFQNKRGWVPLIINVPPRYRYEITFVPKGDKRTDIIVNVHTQNIPDSQLAEYKASSRFELFREIDELALKAPPSPNTPATGGVNFTLLPNEDLRALAKRVTGNADNWRVIAKDNGLKSDHDVKPFENVWVRNRLLKQSATK